MPISLEEYRLPKFIKIKEEKPFSYNSSDKFYSTKDKEQYRRFRSENGDFLQQGYNPSHNVSMVKKININTDDYTLPRY
jgi:hypothetical protein